MDIENYPEFEGYKYKFNKNGNICAYEALNDTVLTMKVVNYKKIKICQSCKEPLAPVMCKDKRNKYSVGKKCLVCGLNYFPYGNYLKIADRANVINSDDLLSLKNKYDATRNAKKKTLKTKSGDFASVKSYYAKLYNSGKLDSNSIAEKLIDRKNSENDNRKMQQNRIEQMLESKAVFACEATSIRFNLPQKFYVTQERYLGDIKNINVYPVNSVEGYVLCSLKKKGEKFFAKHCTYKVLNIIKKDTAFIEDYYKDDYVERNNIKIIKPEEPKKNNEAEKTVYVLQNLENCKRLNHEIINKTLDVVNDFDDNMVQLLVHYCKNCGKYYLQENEIQYYIERNKYPRIKMEYSRSTSFYGLNEESKLHKLGYTVKQGELSDTQRRNLLGWIINSGLMRKYDIENLLKYLRHHQYV